LRRRRGPLLVLIRRDRADSRISRAFLGRRRMESKGEEEEEEEEIEGKEKRRALVCVCVWKRECE